MLEAADFNPVINKALLIGVQSQRQSLENAQGLLDELEELVSNLTIGIVGTLMVKVRQVNPRYLVGTGKVEEILEHGKSLGFDSVIFDEPISPAQQRNWEAAAGGKILVIDRQEIILDIFNKRAQTREARLQVELARLEYNLPRMKRAWTHLDRQRGGGAMQRDAGEKQIEIDQRLIRQRISRLKSELTEVVQHRKVQRKQRMKVPLPTAAIVGYTNAGKSSLLNKITGSTVLAEDMLFATLDPTTRRAELPSGQTLLMTDTVGFVRRLPHRLVDAFKATLEEALVSSFLIHVIDASSPDIEEHFETTRKVLKELGADEQKTITVFNKVDLIEDRIIPLSLDKDVGNSVMISTHTGEGLEALEALCEEMLKDLAQHKQLLIPHQRYDLVNLLHQAGAVTHSEAKDDGVFIEGNIPNRLLDAIQPYVV